MKTPFQLLTVPSFQHELTIKATQSGITVLKESRYRKRYTGSKQSTVDINGNMFLKANDLKKIIADGLPADKKKGRPLKVAPSAESLNGDAKDNALHDLIYKKERLYKVHKTEVRNRLLTMIKTGRGKKHLYFWTVTFPAGTPDDVAYRLYNTWLTTLRQKKWLREYLWIAERQTGERLEDKEKNPTNTIHFHIAIPHFMSITAANGAMRTILKTAAKNNEIPFHAAQCKRYNGVDIAKNRKTKKVVNFALQKGSRSLANYLTKYVTKNDSTFNHLAWHNSRGFSALFTGITFTTNEFIGYGFRQLVKPGVIIDNEYFMFFGWKEDPPFAVTRHLIEINNWIQERSGILENLN